MDEIKRLEKVQGRMQSYAIYDHTHIVAHLEKMAQKGWLLEEMSSATHWLYRQIEPRPLRFMISYVPEAVIEDGQDWQLAASLKTIRIFYSTLDAPAPAQINAVQEVAAMHRRFSRHLLPIAAIFIYFLLFHFASLVSLWQMDPHEPLLWMMLLLLGSMVGYLVFDCASHFKWYKHALVIAEQQGTVLATQDTARRFKFWLAAMGVMLLGLCIGWLGRMI